MSRACGIPGVPQQTRAKPSPKILKHSPYSRRLPHARPVDCVTEFQPRLSLRHSLEFPRSIVPTNPAQRKTPTGIPAGVLGQNPGDDLLSHARCTLPSAHVRFTSEFGMDRVVPYSYSHQGEGGGSPIGPSFDAGMRSKEGLTALTLSEVGK